MPNVNKPYNPAAQIAMYCWCGAVVGIGVFFYPVVFTVGGYGVLPVLFVSGFVIFLSGLISAIVFTRIANTFRAMFSGRGLIVHWTYSKEEWTRYTELEHARNKKEKWSLFRLISIIALVVGGGFVLFEHSAWPVILIMIPGLIALVALVAYATTAATHWQNRKHLGEVYIGYSGVILGRSLHYWKLPASFLDSVKYLPGQDPYLEFIYSAPSGGARGNYTARVPVPEGREDEVEKVLTALSPARNDN